MIKRMEKRLTLESGSEVIRRPYRLGEEVYRILYAQLMSLRIPPGGRLSVDGLARELKVSQTPIREALVRLESQGLVVKIHLIGYCAAEQMDRQRFEDLYGLRMLLEPFAAARAAQNIDDDRMWALEELMVQMRTISADSSRTSYGEFAQKDGEFHNLIAGSCGNKLVQETLTGLHTHVHLFRLIFRSGTPRAAMAEHEDILDGIRRGNAEAAERAMRVHLDESRKRFIDAIL
jgi:DNA-binding GntR family transcriptional regulator